MKAHELKYFADGLWRGHGARPDLRRFVRNFDVNWYQVAVVAVATFAVAMDLLFPPVRVALGRGLDVYMGHIFVPLSRMNDVQVDFTWLAVELMVIVAAAVAGWCLGTRVGDRRKAPQDPL